MRRLPSALHLPLVGMQPRCATLQPPPCSTARDINDDQATYALNLASGTTSILSAQRSRRRGQGKDFGTFRRRRPSQLDIPCHPDSVFPRSICVGFPFPLPSRTTLAFNLSHSHTRFCKGSEASSDPSPRAVRCAYRGFPVLHWRAIPTAVSSQAKSRAKKGRPREQKRGATPCCCST